MNNLKKGNQKKDVALKDNKNKGEGKMYFLDNAMKKVVYASMDEVCRK